MNALLKQPPSHAVQNVAFLPLEMGGRMAATTRRLHQAIALGLLPDGSQLPSEAELAAQFGVSTVTLRSSLAELRRQGLLVTRRGRGGGNFVRLPRGIMGEPMRQRLDELNIDDLRDMRDYHTVMARGSARLAAERARGWALDKLKQAAGAIRHATSYSECARADLWFHMEMAAATRSAQLTRAELAIQTEIAPLLWVPGYEAQTTSAAASDHGNIFAAIEAGDADAASSAAERHASDAINALIELRMELSQEP